MPVKLVAGWNKTSGQNEPRLFKYLWAVVVDIRNKCTSPDSQRFWARYMNTAHEAHFSQQLTCTVDQNLTCGKAFHTFHTLFGMNRFFFARTNNHCRRTILFHLRFTLRVFSFLHANVACNWWLQINKRFTVNYRWGKRLVAQIC